ncbi:helix-turn-helix transcriptional regulator [Pseudoalteromonas luteoviolacea]|uniref:Uncharacterized protein n=1 Tax=Pseudoalteromonas luteoviolacea S4060-1 TaxID=1365257 RepID=A0A167JR26_9GAMM|nr:AlpA family phage regulatory protein [Pseudoalteromonas luteoviolacea]KZN61539.1 hypothetical protein N478_05550 [Pseudoalteromonas luteoviolacea S4060-1]
MSSTNQSILYRTTLKGKVVTAEDKYLRPNEAAKMSSLHRTTLYKLESKFMYPPKYSISNGRVGFLEEDVTEFQRLGAKQFYQIYGDKIREIKEQAA